jgi:DUF4097 and DUF4098 domain-containing protein YvlB
MKPAFIRDATFLAIILPLGLWGCHVSIGGWGQEKFTRIWTAQTPKGTLTGLSVRTHSGAISVTGADVTDFSVTAEITAHAPTEEQARELAEQVEVSCKPNGDTLEISAEYPKPSFNGGVTVSYAVIAPKQMNVQCNSSYGKLTFADLDGTVAGKTSSGSIEARGVHGSVDLDSSYGSVTCADANGPNIVLRTNSGAIHASNISGSLRCGSSYGSVSCKAFSNGDLVLKSSSGRVELSDAIFGTCEASSSYGAVTADHVKGKAMKLHSSSGSITATNAQADQISLSTSYGGVAAHDITTGGLTAESGSGSVDCVLTPDCPPTLAATLSSSYGSVSLTVPTGFAGQVDLSTDYGSIRTDLLVTTSGEISKKKLTGAVGSGPARVHLHTSSGSVTLR